jgi:hypothetical protein
MAAASFCGVVRRKRYSEQLEKASHEQSELAKQNKKPIQ